MIVIPQNPVRIIKAPRCPGTATFSRRASKPARVQDFRRDWVSTWGFSRGFFKVPPRFKMGVSLTITDPNLENLIIGSLPSGTPSESGAQIFCNPQTRVKGLRNRG